MLFRSFLWFLLFLFLAYAFYRVVVLVLKKYNLNPFDTEGFQAKPSVSTPAPVVTMESVPVREPRGPVSPAGPNPPNTTPPPQQPVERLPEERANDTMEQMNSEVPMKENLRHPERMFNAGGDHSGTKRDVESGVSGQTKGTGKFSPDFAQNGGEFMNGIFANDMVKGDNFAEI